MKTTHWIYLTLLTITACSDSSQPQADLTETGALQDRFRVVGQLENRRLDEASGIQAIPGGRYLVHNDEGEDLFVTDSRGRHLARIRMRETKIKDSEDITLAPGPDGPLVVLGDIGDNHARRKQVRLYFFEVPSPDENGKYPDAIEPLHRLKLSYPDGPRDVESMAWDPSSGMILLLSKRDKPPRLYGIPLQQALEREQAEAVFLGETISFRPPTRQDLLRNPHRGFWVSQPTGMDISADGRLAAVLTYRSLYLFRRQDDETWAEALRRKPIEFYGPPGYHDEAVSFSQDQSSVLVTTERRPAPLYEFRIPPEIQTETP